MRLGRIPNDIFDDITNAKDVVFVKTQDWR